MENSVCFFYGLTKIKIFMITVLLLDLLLLVRTEFFLRIKVILYLIILQINMITGQIPHPDTILKDFFK